MTKEPTSGHPGWPVGANVADIISAEPITRDRAVTDLAGHFADRDAFVMMVNPTHLAALVERLHLLPEWTAYIDASADDVIRTDDPGVLLLMDVLMPRAVVLTIPKTVPAAVIGDALDEPFPDDGSRDILMLGFTPGAPMVWSLLFLDALERVDPAMVAEIRAAGTAGLR